MTGQTISHYRIVEKLGEGGMGVVYKAEDLKLGRAVALKFLPSHLIESQEHKARFLHEARAAALLDHPNICTVYEIDEVVGKTFLAMACLGGQTLKQKIAEHPLPLQEALDIATQIGQGLQAAHEKGIVHRDIKPANIMITPQGLVKIMDFGLAQLSDRTKLTETGTRLGTPAYMSPEQVEGKPADRRADIWSLGVVLYEMITGQLPFRGESEHAVTYGIVYTQPEPLTALRSGLPVELDRITGKALAKGREGRYQHVEDLLVDLGTVRKRIDPEAGVDLAPRPGRWRSFLRSPGKAAAALVILALSLASGWMYIRESRIQRARDKVPEVSRLIEAEEISQAFQLARQIGPYLPGDAVLEKLWRDYAFPATLRSKPAGAQVSIRPYSIPGAEWEVMGTTPLENVPLPLIALRLRVEKPGFRGVDIGLSEFNVREFVLHPEAEAPPGMVYVPPGESQFAGVNAVSLPEFWIDKYEVTNQEYKRFVDAGGYSDRKYWKHPFVKEGSILPWDEAIKEFRDSTGRPGPATWEVGTYPEGRGDFPVSGVSWYEAAAYAEFAGKNLPTVYHWYLAAGRVLNPHHILGASNFNGKNVAKAGEYQGVGPFGTFDMAGNVREWCWNDDGALRYILGGSWKEPQYVFQFVDVRTPFDRSEINGFRCVRYSAPPPAEALATTGVPFRDFSKEKPVSDDVFRAFIRMYSYDRTPLRPSVEGTEITPAWRRERITFDAAYGEERVIAYLFLPTNAKPPFQTIVYFPNLEALTSRSAVPKESDIRFIVLSGRALMCPIYKGTYERRSGIPAYGTKSERDRIILWGKDFGRAIDYLETRPEIDSARIGFYGLSLGGVYGPIMTALDTRVKASVLVAAGLKSNSRGCCFRPQPEVDPFNFASRSRTPTLMINGKNDFISPVDDAQKPLFKELGAPLHLKRHAIFEGGHVPNKFQDVIRETLAWFDEHLGPVVVSSTGTAN